MAILRNDHVVLSYLTVKGPTVEMGRARSQVSPNLAEMGPNVDTAFVGVKEGAWRGWQEPGRRHRTGEVIGRAHN